MKILAVSLLRLGDIILASSALSGLKKKYPSSELHVLINKQFEGLKPLLPYVDRYHCFDRHQIQTALGEADRSLFEAYDRFDDFLKPLQDQNFDLIVNFTQNKLSAWIISLIPAKEKSGLNFREDGAAQFGSPWFRHLNQWGLESKGPQFHYSDIFLNAVVGTGYGSHFEISETDAGIIEANKIIGESKKFIAVQLFTNDKKKNWNLDHFYQAIDTFKKMNEGVDVFLLCSPSEKTETLTFKARFKDSRVKLADCSLEGLFSLLKRSSLLLTGDTAVKHLACAALIPIVELSMGSSHFFQTGSYLNDSIIIQSLEPCAPCHHSSDCSQISHLCSTRVPGDLVGLTCSKLLKKDWEGIRVIAEEFNDHAQVFRVAKMSAGHWTAVPVSNRPTHEYIDQLFDQLSWMMLLNGEHHKPVNQVGSIARRLGEFFDRYFSFYDREDIALRLHELEGGLERLEAKIEIFLIDFQEIIKRFDDDSNLETFCQSIEDYSFGLKQNFSLFSYGSTLSNAKFVATSNQKFVTLKRIRESLFDVKHRCQLETKLIRSLKQYMESHL